VITFRRKGRPATRIRHIWACVCYSTSNPSVGVAAREHDWRGSSGSTGARDDLDVAHRPVFSGRTRVGSIRLFWVMHFTVTRETPRSVSDGSGRCASDILHLVMVAERSWRFWASPWGRSASVWVYRRFWQDSAVCYQTYGPLELRWAAIVLSMVAIVACLVPGFTCSARDPILSGCETE